MLVDILLGATYALVMLVIAVGTLERVVAARRNAATPVPRRPAPESERASPSPTASA